MLRKILFLVLILSFNGALAKPKYMKHEFHISNKGVGNSLRLSSQETYYAYFIHPKFLNESLEHWNAKAEKSIAKTNKKYSGKNAGQLKYELKKSKCEIHNKAAWESDEYVTVFVVPYIRFEPGYFGKLGEELHRNSGEITGSKIISKEDQSLVCKPVDTRMINDLDYNYVKHIYGGWDLGYLNTDKPKGFPYDASQKSAVFHYKPECFKSPDVEFILETTTGNYDNDLDKPIFKFIQEDFGV